MSRRTPYLGLTLAALLALSGCASNKPEPPSAGDFARHPEFCTREGGRCLNWAPGAVKAQHAYARLAARYPGELPGQGVKVTVIDSGIDLDHWEFDPDRTSEELFEGTGDLAGDAPSHGTAVASLIGAQREGGGVPSSAARDFHGIAYGATMHVIGFYANGIIDTRVAALLQRGLRSQGGPDIMNMSWGPLPASLRLVEDLTESTVRMDWQSSIQAAAQGSTPARDRALLVWAVGNSNGQDCASFPHVRCEGGKTVASSPNELAGAMAHIPELRSHSVAVVATDRDGEISGISHRCGIAAKWCIAAPGEDMLVAYWGPGGTSGTEPGHRGYLSDGTLTGTSFAAPVVSGGLAVVMHYFRGQLGNPEVLARVLKTADVTPDRVAAGEQCPLHLDTDGDRSDCELSSTHGRGLMNLDAATRPVGTLRTGVRGGMASLDGTVMRTPAAWGGVSGWMGGAEIAAFDSLNAPFWVPLESRLVRGAGTGAPIPSFEDEARGRDDLAWRGLAWTPPGALPRIRPVRLAYTADADGDVSAAGLSLDSRGGAWQTGLVFEQGGILGEQGEGAFAGEAVHGLAFGTFRKSFPLRGGEDGGPDALRLVFSSTLAGGRLGGANGMLRDARGLYSQHRVALDHTQGEALTRVSLEQPLRAEGGSLSFRRPVGRTRDGEWIYDTHKVGLRPQARALTLGLHHERPLGQGRIALGFNHTVDAGHVPGEEESSIGARYRRRF